jgi:putative endonuclease
MPLTDPRHVLGQIGEEVAADYLAKRGMRLVERHFRTRYGEIDLIGLHQDTWVFVEVKTRSKASVVAAAESIHGKKRNRMVNVALTYMKRHGLEGRNMRFDIVLIEGPRLEWIPDAFEGDDAYTF